MEQNQAIITTAQETPDTNARLVARLKQLLHTPGISDKDRKLIDRNIQRLVEVSGTSGLPAASGQRL